MTVPGSLLAWSDLAGMFGHFLVLSLLSIGGAIAVVPDMHRYVVVERHWLDDTAFTSSVAIAQASPGPNVLFVAVIGWNVAGPLGMLATMSGILLPSTLLTLAARRWSAARRETLPVRAFVAGMAPLSVGLLLATGWVLSVPSFASTGAMALLAVTVLASLRTAISPIWLVALGAVVGALGFA